MRLKKAISSLAVFMLLGVGKICAQTEAMSFSLDILAWVSKLDRQIDTYFKKEQVDQLDRKLQYFKSDLQSYLIIRRYLLDMLDERNYEIPPNDVEIDTVVAELRANLKDIMKRLTDIRPLVSNELSEEAEEINYDLMAPFVSQQRYLNSVDSYLRSPIDKQYLKITGNKIYKELWESVKLLTKIQEKLHRKLAQIP